MFFPPKLIRPRRALLGVGNDLRSRSGTTESNIHHQVVTKFTHDKEPALWKRLNYYDFKGIYKLSTDRLN